MLGKFYQCFWFKTEFWLTPVDRRPYTFIWRDWIYTHIVGFIALTSIWYAGVIVLSVRHGTASTLLAILSSLIVAHLIWGSAWIEKQQEFPGYNPEEVSL